MAERMIRNDYCPKCGWTFDARWNEETAAWVIGCTHCLDMRPERMVRGIDLQGMPDDERWPIYRLIERTRRRDDWQDKHGRSRRV